MLSNTLSKINYIITETCNANCPFCFQMKATKTKKQLTNYEIIKFTNFVIKHYKQHNKKELTLELIGGEPMLFKDFNIFKNVIDLYVKNDFVIHEFCIFSNAFYINETFIELCNYIKNKVKEIKFKTTINIDDKFPNRIFKNNLKKFYDNLEKIKKEIPFIKITEHSIFDYTLKDKYEDFINYNIKHPHKMKYINFTEYIGKFNFKEDDYYNFTKILLKKINFKELEKKENLLLIESSGLSYIMPLLFNYKFDCEEKNICEPVKSEIGIAPGGYICSCSRLLEFKTYFPTIHENENIILSKLKKYFKDNSKRIVEDGSSCNNCILKIFCKECKIISGIFIEQNGIFLHPKEKCKFEYMKFIGQYKAVKEFLLKDGNNGKS